MLFSKLGNTANKLFSKSNVNGFFRKVNNTARKVDNSVAKVGAFLHPIASNFGLGGTVSNIVDQTHAIRNNLEKAIKAPISQIRHNYN